MTVDESRVRVLNDRPANPAGACVVYWMQKDQRADDNWALLRAAELAGERGRPVLVAFFVSERLRNAYARHYDFMLRGLAETARKLRGLGAGFVLRHESPAAGIARLARELDAAVVVTDQSYLRLGRDRRARAAALLDVRLEAVDAAVIVPPAVLADKALYAARVARPRLTKHFPRYLTDLPAARFPVAWTEPVTGLDDQDPDGVRWGLDLDDSVGPVDREPGAEAAARTLRRFLVAGPRAYQERRNDPTARATSELSAYLRFGQLSSQRVAYDLVHSPAYADDDREAIDAYLDELITWRELAVNFCHFHDDYDTFAAAPDWARKTLAKHAADPRPDLYDRDELEHAATHDELWNAAQTEMVRTGRMHGYLRMYWGKKILEWSPTPAVAVEWAVYLNDKYELDGREPGGYTGILWAIGGLHDRPWFDREIFGTVRYLSYGGARSKFDVAAYIDWARSR